MSDQIIVRAARAEDKPAVVAFCQNTFSWGDYIADVYDRWVSDSNGFALVGVADENPVALAHVAFLDGNVAWMEGMRVHPDFRKLGIGSIVDARARQLARERGRHVARLVTSTKNVAAQALLAKQGYQRIVKFNEWKAEPSAEIDFHVELANSTHVEKIQTMWNSSFAQSPWVQLLDRYWHWAEMNAALAQQYIQAGEVRLAGNGFGILLAFDEVDWNGLSLYALCGDETTMRQLAMAARGEAHYRGYAHSEAFLVDHPRINAAMEDAGYQIEGGVYLYEQMLK